MRQRAVVVVGCGYSIVRRSVLRSMRPRVRSRWTNGPSARRTAGQFARLIAAHKGGGDGGSPRRANRSDGTTSIQLCEDETQSFDDVEINERTITIATRRLSMQRHRRNCDCDSFPPCLSGYAIAEPLF